MKKLLPILIMSSLLLALVTGCTPNTPVKPSPVPTHSAAPTAVLTPAPTMSAEPTVAPSGSPSAGADEISGFVAGTVVDPKDVPDIVAAINKKYPKAEITSITHALYKDMQVYHITMTGTDDGTTQVYVRPNGTILPYEDNGGAQASASPKA